MTNEQYIAAARAQCSDGEIEVDDGAVVSRGSDPGAYVAAWIWVDDPIAYANAYGNHSDGECDCESRSWSGDKHDSECVFSGKSRHTGSDADPDAANIGCVWGAKESQQIKEFIEQIARFHIKGETYNDGLGWRRYRADDVDEELSVLYHLIDRARKITGIKPEGLVLNPRRQRNGH